MMNNLDEQGENLLRDKLLRHEFAADEQAWEKMDALLAARSESELAPIACWPLLRKPPSKWLAGLLLVAGLGAGWMIHMDSPTAHRYPGAEMIGQNMSPDAGTTIVPASGDNAVHKPAPDNASQPHEKALVGRNPGNFKNTIQANTRWAGGKGFPAEPALKTAEGVIKITGKANQIIAKQAPT
ncbi:MAG: hypothetical protein ABIO24_08915, partial [Saprospiraceae bacterium]